MSRPLHDLIVIGAGPIGLEMGLAAVEAGLDVLILERGAVAQNLDRWGFVPLFSSWQQNTSERGRAICEGTIEPERPLSGREFRTLYCLPLAESPALAGRLRLYTRVLSIGRAGGFKNSHIGDPARAKLPFHILAESEGEERLYRARNVVDASGVYGNHRWLGSGGIPAEGELAASARIFYELIDLREHSERWADKTVLVVGAGFSACTAMEQLHQLRASGVSVHAHWLLLGATPSPIEDDPLPHRRQLAEFARRISASPPSWLRLHRGRCVRSLRIDGDLLEVALEGEEMPIRCDRLLAHVGFRPDRSLSEELQFHECWATSGPMKLAAALLSQTAEAGGDCLVVGDAEPETLRNPEPGFFVLGAKSYGRNPDFLIQRGQAQVEAVLSFLTAESMRAQG